MAERRKAKKLLKPLNATYSAAFEGALADQALILGRSESDVLIDCFMMSNLPHGKFARDEMIAVYGRKVSLLGSVAETLLANTNGPSGVVRHSDYAEIVEFGLKLILDKRLGTLLDTGHNDMHYMRSRFESVVNRLRKHLSTADDPTDEAELIGQIQYAEDLLVECDPDKHQAAPAYAYVQFALDNWHIIGDWKNTCDYLSCLFGILRDTETDMQGSTTKYIPVDTPDLRVKWAQVLGRATADW